MVSVESNVPSPQHWGVWFSSTLSTLLPSHRHSCPELNLIVSGSMAYKVEGYASPLEARAGQIIVLPLGAHHESVRASKDLTLWVIELNGVEPLTWLDSPHVLTPHAEWRRAVQACARALWLRPNLVETLQLQTRLWQALSSFSAEPSEPSNQPLHPAVVRAKALCETLVDQELDISRLAKESGLSASRLAHLFAEQVGVSPLQYRNFVRIQHFVRTYDDDERNLMRAALGAGFGSYAQFHRVFRQVCGKPPAIHFKWLSESGEVDAQRTLSGASSPSATPSASLVAASLAP